MSAKGCLLPGPEASINDDSFSGCQPVAHHGRELSLNGGNAVMTRQVADLAARRAAVGRVGLFILRHRDHPKRVEAHRA
jgi:hypothetical protein